jgi:hypothetical protein
VGSETKAAGDLSIESTDEGVEIEHPRRRRRWVVILCVVVALLLLFFTPPLVNVNRLKRRIATSISASLGRPVQLDHVTLHLLPVPGFTLQNFVVSEDPAFGAEPIIRANVVDVTLRPSSLWRRHVEFSTMKFESPSLNLVRNAAGMWNVQSLLMHAASVSTAPTAQRKAGPEPRFPYIEATDARVNVKLGEEKKPFSLTDADFALWLTSPQEWRVRAKGTPARTDANISDPGTVKLEGSLKRAATMAEVPVDLTASWSGAPMGEASKMLTGQDAGWRGNLNVEASLVGNLGAAKLTTTIHMEELRRAEFVPLETMDVVTECRGTVDVTTADGGAARGDDGGSGCVAVGLGAAVFAEDTGGRTADRDGGRKRAVFGGVQGRGWAMGRCISWRHRGITALDGCGECVPVASVYADDECGRAGICARADDTHAAG